MNRGLFIIWLLRKPPLVAKEVSLCICYECNFVGNTCLHPVGGYVPWGSTLDWCPGVVHWGSIPEWCIYWGGALGWTLGWLVYWGGIMVG